MKTASRNMTDRLLALLAAFTLSFAHGGVQAQQAYAYSQQELDQMLAPIALYPDPLLSQILMAATYPLEVDEAARWAMNHPGLAGDDAVRAAETENWDPSVKSLLAFPQVLARLGENPQWTQALGNAFLDQQSQVMDTVQALRRRAQAAGNLRSDERISVVENGSSLALQPPDPQVVYVPYYDPQLVYGSWWWPAYPPVYFRPWPGYYAPPARATGFYWGPSVWISAGFFFGNIDWRRRQVQVVHVDSYYRHRVAPNRVETVRRAPGVWHHEPERRRGIAYRDIETQRRFGGANAPVIQGIRPKPADPRGSAERVQPRPATQIEAQPESRFERRREARGAGQAAQPAPITHPAPPPQAAPAAPRAPVAHDNAQATRREPGGARETPRAPPPRMEARPAQGAAQPAVPAAARPEHGARHEVPPAAAPRSESRPPQAATRQEPEARPAGRSRMTP